MPLWDDDAHGSGKGQSMRAGVKEVAQRAGVSVGTVSNVLNRPESVTEATRQRVEAAMTELAFVRNASARQLRAGTSQAVGAIVLDLRNPFYTALARGIEDRLLADGLMLMVASSDEDPRREKEWIGLFAEQGVRGLLVTPSKGSREQLQRLGPLGIPVVLLDSTSTKFASVGVDNVSGARQAVRHLLEQGHRRIAHLSGPDHLRQSKDRLKGAREAVIKAGLDPEDVLIVRHLPAMSADHGQAGLQEVITLADPPTAVFCINDIVALGVMRELRLRRLEIPRDMAVVGYDDVTFAAELMTPLTSVRQPMHALGWTAADILLSSSTPNDHRTFRPELVIRESSVTVAGE